MRGVLGLMIIAGGIYLAYVAITGKGFLAQSVPTPTSESNPPNPFAVHGGANARGLMK